MRSAFTTRLERIEHVLTGALPAKNNSNWQFDSFGKLDDAVSDTHIAGLIDSCNALLSLGGKRWRPLLLVLCAEMTSDFFSKSDKEKKQSVDNAYKLTPLVEFTHTASLIHDDIEDSADMRRGKPAAHITYGLDIALNAGSWLYFEAPVCINSLEISDAKKNTLYSLYLNELRRLHLGQAMDIEWHRAPSLIPTTDEYTSMVRNKTGTLARLAVKIGILAGGGTKEDSDKAGAIAEGIGVGFQIIDDVTNLTTGNPGKKRGDDIVEGKKSLPVLIHLSEHKDDTKKLADLFAVARKDGIESPAVEEAISILTKSGAVQKAAQKGKNLVYKKSRELAGLYGQEETESAKLIIELFDNMLGG